MGAFCLRDCLSEPHFLQFRHSWYFEKASQTKTRGSWLKNKAARLWHRKCIGFSTSQIRGSSSASEKTGDQTLRRVFKVGVTSGSSMAAENNVVRRSIKATRWMIKGAACSQHIGTEYKWPCYPTTSKGLLIFLTSLQLAGQAHA